MSLTSEIYDWFMTGKKPTQAQFWASWGSFWNKAEQIPQSSISGLAGVLNAKAEKAQFDAHKTDENAHAALFAAKADAQALLDHIQATFEAIGIELQSRVYGDESLQFQIDDTNDFVSQARSDIEAITTILNSDDINLDTVQEIVDAIKTVETSLSTILVNDLTTGGTTKALTAEMGKTLKGLIDGLTANKVDKVAGERLINAAEITKLAAVTNVTTTVKIITSASLATQDVAGFVAYINALSVVLVVGANEIVEYQLSDTGRLFKLLLRGRNFGVGQAAIVAADVLEITDFLNKDIKLSNYPSTRNDGQLPTNKVLSTDVNGNLKMYTIATAPPPYLEVLIPDSSLPSTTTNFILKGAFFTPTMTVVIAGQTINSKTFISDNEVRLGITTGAAEGSFSVTLNNGISATFPGALLIVLGTIYEPTEADWVSKTNIDVSVPTYPKIIANSVDATAKWVFPIDYTKNWMIVFTMVRSPYATSGENSYFSIYDTVTNLPKIQYRWINMLYHYNNGNSMHMTTEPVENSTFKLKKVGSLITFYKDGVLIDTPSTSVSGSTPVSFTNNLDIRLSLRNSDIKGIKYIEIA